MKRRVIDREHPRLTVADHLHAVKPLQSLLAKERILGNLVEVIDPVRSNLMSARDDPLHHVRRTLREIQCAEERRPDAVFLEDVKDRVRAFG